MLVLSRRVGEEVLLPDLRVRVVVLGVTGGRVRVGVVAPGEVVVLRGELGEGAAPATSPQVTRHRGTGRSDGGETAGRRVNGQGDTPFGVGVVGRPVDPPDARTGYRAGGRSAEEAGGDGG